MIAGATLEPGRGAPAAPLHPGGLALTERMLACCGLVAGDRALDVGCGTGATVRLLRGRGVRAAGLDASPATLARAAAGTPGAWVRGSGAALPVASGSLDCVLLECSLSLLPEPELALRECARVLAVGGRLALSDVYARAAGPGGPTPAGAPVAALAAERGAGGLRLLSRAGLLAALAAGPLELELWEDHSQALAAFAAARLLADAGDDPGCCCGAGCDEEAALLGGRGGRAGLFLLIASKAPRGRARGGLGR